MKKKEELENELKKHTYLPTIEGQKGQLDMGGLLLRRETIAFVINYHEKHSLLCIRSAVEQFHIKRTANAH